MFEMGEMLTVGFHVASNARGLTLCVERVETLPTGEISYTLHVRSQRLLLENLHAVPTSNLVAKGRSTAPLEASCINQATLMAAHLDVQFQERGRIDGVNHVPQRPVQRGGVHAKYCTDLSVATDT